VRRIVLALASTVTGLVLLFSWPTSLNRGTTALAAPGTGTTGSGTTSGTSGSGPSPATSAPATASGSSAGTHTYTGAPAQTRYGPVTVQITVTNGKLSDVKSTRYPTNSPTDQMINSYAIPVLNSEALQSGSANIAMVSGATFTSMGYLKSLQDALDQAHL
jgi:uncharacterized protein with FMN-binding domain